jgi:spermidine synthase
MPETGEKPISIGWMLEFTVFVCGALVMIYEIIGSRIIAPFLGASTYVWTSLIGVILGALSLGYWLGGKTADSRPHVRVLAGAIFAAGGLVGLTILFKDIALTMISQAPVWLEVRTFLAALVLFAPASVALGFVIPYATKLRLGSLQDSGKTVGRLYALSTIGSIAGTFLAGFVLIPFIGSVRTLYLIAVVLFGLAILLGGLSFSRHNLALVTIFVFGVVGSEGTAYLLFRSNNLYDIDTEYSRVRVFDLVDPASGRMMKAMATDPSYIQSARYLDGGDLALAYTRFYHLVRSYKPGHKRALMIGGAGYSFPQAHLRTFPDSTIDVVEIDPGMTIIAGRFFNLKDDPRLHIFHEDGRMFLRNRTGERYDAVFMDAFGSLFTVPYQLTTIEAVRDMHKQLADDGIVIFNIGSAIRGPASYFLRAELATYNAVFADVHLYRIHPENSDERLQNLMIVACKSVCSSDLSPTNDTTAFDGTNLKKLLSSRYTGELQADLPVLTDDLAPVDRYNSLAQGYK